MAGKVVVLDKDLPEMQDRIRAVTTAAWDSFNQSAAATGCRPRLPGKVVVWDKDLPEMQDRIRAATTATWDSYKSERGSNRMQAPPAKNVD